MKNLIGMILLSVLFSVVETVEITAQEKIGNLKEYHLEHLWSLALENSVDYKSASLSFDYAESAYKNRRSLYPFSFRTNLTSSFNDVYSDLSWYTSSSTANATLSKQNPYGNTVSGTVSYGITRNVLDIFEKVDFDNIGYSHSPSFDLSIQQSLNPAILSGDIKNPELAILKNNIQGAQYSKENVELSVCKTVTDYYIQHRCALREVNKYKSYLDFYDKKIAAAQELYKNSKNSLSELWTLENKKWEYFQNYIQTLNTIENIELELVNLSGSREEISKIDEEENLPSYETYCLPHNPEKLRLETQIQTLKFQNLLTKQSSAPVLSFGGTFTENTGADDSFAVNFIEDKTTFNWSFSLGISFTEFFSPSKKLKEEVFQNNLTIYTDQLNALNEQTENQLENYVQLIKAYERQIEKMQNVLENRTLLAHDFEKLYRAGKCSLIELEEVRINVTEAECMLENLKDYLWLYKWERSQCR